MQLQKSRGLGHMWSKTTPQSVAEIRAKHLQGVSNAALGREYNLHRTTIIAIVRGRTWKGIEPSEVCSVCGGYKCRVNKSLRV